MELQSTQGVVFLLFKVQSFNFLEGIFHFFWKRSSIVEWADHGRCCNLWIETIRWNLKNISYHISYAQPADNLILFAKIQRYIEVEADRDGHHADVVHEASTAIDCHKSYFLQGEKSSLHFDFI